MIANAWSGGSSDGDEFRFEFSLDGGGTWASAFIISETDPATTKTVPLPATGGGNVLVRVRDSDRTQGHRTLDTVFIDELLIHTETMPGTPPAVPTGSSATPTGTHEVSLAWTDNAGDEFGFQVERLVSGSQEWTLLGTVAANATTYSDSSASPNTTFSYRVRAYSGSGTSEYSNLANATTPAGITLAAAGRKEKGIAIVDLTWSGAATGNVDIFRNGQKIGTVPDDGAYTDNTGQKGTFSSPSGSVTRMTRLFVQTT